MHEALESGAGLPNRLLGRLPELVQDLRAARAFELLIQSIQGKRHHVAVMEFALGYFLGYFQPDPVDQLDILRSEIRRVRADLEAMRFALVADDDELELRLVRIVDLLPGLSNQVRLGSDREFLRS